MIDQYCHALHWKKNGHKSINFLNNLNSFSWTRLLVFKFLKCVTNKRFYILFYKFWNCDIEIYTLVNYIIFLNYLFSVSVLACYVYLYNALLYNVLEWYRSFIAGIRTDITIYILVHWKKSLYNISNIYEKNVNFFIYLKTFFIYK